MPSSRKIALHAAVETVYGTLVVLAAANTIVTNGLEIMPFESTTVSRDLDRANFGADQELHIGLHAKIKFNTELVGSGTLGVVPRWEILALASKCKTTVVAATSVLITPDSNGQTSLSMEFNLDGNRHRLRGARGDCKLTADSQGIPYLEWTFTGLYVDPSAAAPLTRSSTGWAQPRPMTFQDTPGIEFFGVLTGWSMKGFALEFGNKVEYFNNPGEESVEITDRESKGNIELLERGLAVFNPFQRARDNEIGALRVTHGTTAATRVIFGSDRAQILLPKYGDDRDRVTLPLGLSFSPSDAGDDEWYIRMAAV